MRNELLLVVGYMKYHSPDMESASTSGRYEFKTRQSAGRPVPFLVLYTLTDLV